jgi:NADH-quinone oxidoreductase subunit N
VAPALYWLVGIAIVGVVISIWYYFGVIRVMYWSAPAAETGSIRVPGLLRVVLLMCIVGMLLLGILPEPMMKITRYAAGVFGKPAAASQTALTVRAPAQH